MPQPLFGTFGDPVEATGVVEGMVDLAGQTYLGAGAFQRVGVGGQVVCSGTGPVIVEVVIEVIVEEGLFGPHPLDEGSVGSGGI